MLRVEEWLEGSDLSRIADRLKTQDVNDVTIRQQFLQLVIENQRDPAAFIRIIVDLATMHQRFSAALPLALLEDWIDVMRVDQFHLAFNVLKDTTSIILTPGSEDFRKISTSCLRICNRMLVRLSASRDSELRGQVLLLLAFIFSVDERSGLNLKNLFHVENITKPDLLVTSVDQSCYLELWKLQDYFRDPTVLHQNVQAQAEFLDLIRSVFSAFQKKPLIQLKSKESEFGAILEFPKYLTSPSIFPLQMQDGQFRKQVLIQCLIILQFLKIGSKKIVVTISDPLLSAIPELEATSKELLSGCFPSETSSTSLQELLSHFDRETIWMVYKDGNCSTEIAKNPTSWTMHSLDQNSLSQNQEFTMKQGQDDVTPAELLEDDSNLLNIEEDVTSEEFMESLQSGTKRSWAALRVIRRKNISEFSKVVNPDAGKKLKTSSTSPSSSISISASDSLSLSSSTGIKRKLKEVSDDSQAVA